MQKITWKQWLIFGFGLVCIIYGILKSIGIVDLRGESEFFARGNLLENSLRINRSTRDDHEKFKTEGGLSKTDMWHGYRVASYKIRYDDQSGKVSGVDLDLKREFVHNMGFTTTVVTVNDLKKLLNSVCSRNGEEWFSMRLYESDLYGVSLKKYPNLKYECGVLDNPAKQTVSVVINLHKETAPSPADANQSSAPTQQVPTKEKPKPISLRVCKDSDAAYRTFKQQISAAIVDEEVKLDSSDACQQVTVMSNDQSVISHVIGLGDRKFQMEHPIAFEISIMDADCEKQCVDKASGWVSSYELPYGLWPTEDEWMKGRANKANLDGHVANIAAANRVSRNINNRQDLSPDQRQDLYSRGRDTYNSGVQFLKNYDF